MSSVTVCSLCPSSFHTVSGSLTPFLSVSYLSCLDLYICACFSHSRLNSCLTTAGNHFKKLCRTSPVASIVSCHSPLAGSTVQYKTHCDKKVLGSSHGSYSSFIQVKCRVPRDLGIECSSVAVHGNDPVTRTHGD